MNAPKKTRKIDGHAIGLIFPGTQHLGYTNAVKALLAAYTSSQTTEITDLDANGAEEKFGPGFIWLEPNAKALKVLREAAEAEDSGKFDIITAGPVGLRFLKSSLIYPPHSIHDAISRKQARVFWVSEKFYEESLSIFQTLPEGSVAMLVPEQVKQRYIKEYPTPAELIRFGEIDYMASEDREKMKQAADDFFSANTGENGSFNAREFFATTEAKYLFMLGGGLKDEKGNAIPNDPKEFARMAEAVETAALDRDILVTTHGLRTFAGNSDTAFKKFLIRLRKLLQRRQSACVFGQEFVNGEKIPTLFRLHGSNGRGGSNMSKIPYKGNAHNALCFHAALSPETIEVGATADQALALPEHLARGGAGDLFSTFLWDMCDAEANANAALVEDKIKSYVPTVEDVLAGYTPMKDAKEKFLEIERSWGKTPTTDAKEKLPEIKKVMGQPSGLLAKMEYFRAFGRHYR